MDDNVGNSINAQGGYDNHKLEDNKTVNYSPSVSYNYGTDNNNMQSIKKSSQKSSRSRQQGGANQGKKRNDNKKKNNNPINPNQIDKMLRQNDSIIKLLKEIRDRLPASTDSESVATTPVASKPEKKKKAPRKQRVYRFENDEAVVKDGADADEGNLTTVIEKSVDTDSVEKNSKESVSSEKDGNSATNQDVKVDKSEESISEI